MSKLKQKYSEYSSSSSSEEEDDEDIIDCICDSTEDDGFTIQCEKCDIWQHAKCYQIKKKNIPDHFVCDRCIVVVKKPSQQQQPQQQLQQAQSSRRRRHNSLDSSAESKKKKMMKTKKHDSKATSLLKERKKKSLVKREDNEEVSMVSKKFIPITKSVAKEKVVQDLFIEVHRQWIESNRPLKHSSSSNSSNSANNSNHKKTTGNKGLDSIVVMESNLLLPAIPKASLKPIRKSLRGSSSFFQNKNDPSVKKGIFADIHIPENRYLMEVVGQVIRKSEYKTDPKNKFTALGTPLPRIFFYPSLDICINTRHTGNDTRFIRRSCCPNSEMKSIILPNDSEDQTIHLGLYTKEPVDKGEELTIGWNWHRGHIMWKKSKEFSLSKSKNNLTAELMDDAAKKSLQDTLNLIHDEFGKCACEDEEDCLFEYLKDELEREPDKEVQPVVQKKKSSPNPVGRPRKEKPVPTSNSIFTSDEDESAKPTIKPSQRTTTAKQPKFIDKSNVASPAASPAVSVEESVDIDITSMSPTPDEMNTTTTSGLKRARTFTSSSSPLPCKKRWLKIYAAQQKQHLQHELLATSSPHPVDIPPTTTTSTPTPLPDLNSTKYLENEYDEAELSDGASSQSTLPLNEDCSNNNISSNPSPPLDNKVVDTSSSSSSPPLIKSEQENSTKETPLEQSTAPLPPVDSIDGVEQVSDKKVVDKLETPSSPINNEEDNTLSAPKVKKLSIQEYLKRQRGNLPTPDEKL